ncbi:hypothetical protein B0H19DRAFT_218871 [Mycena capillaripes]|nr:hypothetical protein B0H19DRAFT_218871 [Mycena capillaripes]
MSLQAGGTFCVHRYLEHVKANRNSTRGADPRWTMNATHLCDVDGAGGALLPDLLRRRAEAAESAMTAVAEAGVYAKGKVRMRFAKTRNDVRHGAEGELFLLRLTDEAGELLGRGLLACGGDGAARVGEGDLERGAAAEEAAQKPACFQFFFGAERRTREEIVELGREARRAYNEGLDVGLAAGGLSHGCGDGEGGDGEDNDGCELHREK